MTLLRHGKVERDFEGCYNGHNAVPLSAQGRDESAGLKRLLDPRAFDQIYCSDLRRAKETLAAFCDRTDVVYTDALREKSWGRHEGLRYEQITAMEGATYQNFHQWLSVLDGEDYPSYIERVKIFFLDFLPKQKHEGVLVVTHAGVIRILFHLLEQLSLEEAFSREIGYGEFVTLTLPGEVAQCG